MVVVDLVAGCCFASFACFGKMALLLCSRLWYALSNAWWIGADIFCADTVCFGFEIVRQVFHFVLLTAIASAYCVCSCCVFLLLLGAADWFALFFFLFFVVLSCLVLFLFRFALFYFVLLCFVFLCFTLFWFVLFRFCLIRFFYIFPYEC